MPIPVLINSWEKYNARGDVKASSWFRLQNNFLTDPAVFELSNDDKVVLISLFCMASQRQSKQIYVSPKLTGALCGISGEAVEAALDKLQKAGIVSTNVDVTPAAADVTHTAVDVSLQTDRQTDRQTDPEGLISGLRPSQLMEIWNSNRGSLDAAARMTSKRMGKASSRLREAPEPSYWVTVVQKLAASSFATGKNDRGWKASFDWLLENDTNHVKASEGKYDDKGAKKPEAKKALTMEELHDLVS